MRHLWMIAVLAVFCGCQGPGEEVQVLPRPRRRATGPAFESYVVCDLDIITIPRSAHQELEQLFSYTETAGVYGPGRRLMALNGLRIARSDTRFRPQFTQALRDVKTGPPKRKTYVRLPQGKQQIFHIGEILHEETLFVWDTPDSVTGLHFRDVQYRMSLSLEDVRGDVAELGIAWRALRRLALKKPVSIPALDTRVELEVGQSVLIAPADFRGHGVGRAFLSGVEEKAVELTFFVITPTEIREKVEPTAEKGSALLTSFSGLWWPGDSSVPADFALCLARKRPPEEGRATRPFCVDNPVQPF